MDMMEKVLKKLQEHFPDVEDTQVFFTDYAGDENVEIIGGNAAVYLELKCMEICEACCVKKFSVADCSLPEKVKNKKSRLVLKVKESSKGFKYFEARRTCGLCCKHNALRGHFGDLFKKSGLKGFQNVLTFGNYITGENLELKKIFMQVYSAFKNQESVIISGNPGTGKTHLAVAVALENMKQNRSAIFRLVPEMLDEIRELNLKSGSAEYFDLLRNFECVDCLVLDDFGKEKLTDTSASYLHRIVDYRYRNKLQTVITTQCTSTDFMDRTHGLEFMLPIFSRVVETGRWVSISDNVANFRLQKRN